MGSPLGSEEQSAQLFVQEDGLNFYKMELIKDNLSNTFTAIVFCVWPLAIFLSSGFIGRLLFLRSSFMPSIVVFFASKFPFMSAILLSFCIVRECCRIKSIRNRLLPHLSIRPSKSIVPIFTNWQSVSKQHWDSFWSVELAKIVKRR